MTGNYIRTPLLSLNVTTKNATTMNFSMFSYFVFSLDIQYTFGHDFSIVQKWKKKTMRIENEMVILLRSLVFSTDCGRVLFHSPTSVTRFIHLVSFS